MQRAKSVIVLSSNIVGHGIVLAFAVGFLQVSALPSFSDEPTGEVGNVEGGLRGSSSVIPRGVYL